MKKELEKIWTSEYFKEGYRCFWLYNYTFFRIVDGEEFEWLNSTILQHPVRAFAVADLTSGDGECSAILYYKDNEIYIQNRWNIVEPIELKKIAGGLDGLFGTQDYSSVLIKKDDRTFWGWSEQVYHNYDIERSVPKGVLPNFDLRLFFKDEVAGTFLTDYKSINIDAFEKYFENFGVTGVNRNEVVSYTASIDHLSEFLNKVNAQLGSETFYAVWFHPSAFMGIVNLSVLKPEEKQRFDELGFFGSNF